MQEREGGKGEGCAGRASLVKTGIRERIYRLGMGQVMCVCVCVHWGWRERMTGVRHVQGDGRGLLC